MKALLLALLLPMAASAQEVVFHLVSSHSKPTFVNAANLDEPYNNTNLGVGYQFENNVVVGVYHNSYRKTAAYIGKMWLWDTPIRTTSPIQVGFVGMLATGYKDLSGNVLQPAGGLIVKIPIGDRFRVNLVTSGNLSHIAVGYRF